MIKKGDMCLKDLRGQLKDRDGRRYGDVINDTLLLVVDIRESFFRDFNKSHSNYNVGFLCLLPSGELGWLLGYQVKTL